MPDADTIDAARRFTWLVDVFYDERVKLVCSAAAPPEQIFTADGVPRSTEFARTVSWLTQMQSTEYLQSEKPNRQGTESWHPSRRTALPSRTRA